jgi:excisionase family DNA binding protein
MRADGHTVRDVAKYLGVSRATLYRYLADDAA